MSFDSTRRELITAAAALPALSSTPSAEARASGGALLHRDELDLAPRLTYLNTASAGPTPKRVLASVIRTWRTLESNPVPMAYYFEPGTAVTEADTVRAKAAALLACSSEEILLTQSTTDAMTTVSNSIQLRQDDRVLLTDKEHEGGEIGWLYRQRRDGIHVDRVQLSVTDHDAGAIVQKFNAAITPRTRVISVSHVIASTGLRMPIAEIAALARTRGVLCVVDGAQAVGEIDVDVKRLGCHAYATSGHKWLMGPKGTGILYVSNEAAPAIEPVQWELGRHFGSDSAGLGPITLMAGLGAAIDILASFGMRRVEERVLSLRNRLYARLREIPQVRVVSPPPGPSATALVAFALPTGLSAQELQERLEERHQIVIKLGDRRFFNGNRFSPHIFNTEAEVDFALAALREELLLLSG